MRWRGSEEGACAIDAAGGYTQRRGQVGSAQGAARDEQQGNEPPRLAFGLVVPGGVGGRGVLQARMRTQHLSA